MGDDPVLTRGSRLEPRHHELIRQAYLLTGDRDRAVRLAEQALGAVPRDAEQADGRDRTDLRTLN